MKNKYRILSLFLSFSSTILFLAWATMAMAEKGLFSRNLGFLLFVGLIFSFFILVLFKAKGS